jgi:hypothetical protein
MSTGQIVAFGKLRRYKDEVFMTSVTHVAGPVVSVHGRAIQRCPVCGEKLCDNLGQTGPVNDDGSAPEFLAFGERRLIEVMGGNPTRYVDVGDFVQCETLPENFCLALVEK